MFLITRPYSTDIVTLKFSTASFTIHRHFLEFRGKKLLEKAIGDPPNTTIDLSMYCAGIGESLANFLYTGLFPPISPLEAHEKRAASRGGLLARLDACVLAQELESKTLKDQTLDALFMGISNIGAVHVLRIVKAAFPELLVNDADWKAMLDKLATKPIIKADHDDEGFLTTRRQPRPDDVQRAQGMITWWEFHDWTVFMRNAYVKAVLKIRAQTGPASS